MGYFRTNYQHIGDWASSISHSTCNATLVTGEQGRICHTEFGEVAETITRCDVEKGIFSYRTEKPPFFIRNATNTLRVNPEGPERTYLEMQAEMNLIPILGWLTTSHHPEAVAHLGGSFCRETEFYAEMGNIHPRKVEARSKAARRDRNTPQFVDQR